MGLSWQQGPLGGASVGHFLTAEPLPQRLLFAEPLRRRLRVKLAGERIVDSEDVILLHEPGRYPVAYFALADVRAGVFARRYGRWKAPVSGRVKVCRLGLDGDGQADLLGHCGEHRAVLVYQLSSYRHWQEHLERDPFAMGQFGENLTVDGLEDGLVCIGDRYRIGSAAFQVSQPRVRARTAVRTWSRHRTAVLRTARWRRRVGPVRSPTITRRLHFSRLLDAEPATFGER